MTYTINFSDPLKGSFPITDTQLDGLGGLTNNTTLRLYGTSTSAWGESVNENFLRLMEHFAGATEPHNPTAGQQWFKQTLYTQGAANTWWRWNQGTVAWVDITADVTSPTGSNTAPVAPVNGVDYWFTGLAPVGTDYLGNAIVASSLYKWTNGMYPGMAPAWVRREFNPSGVNPVANPDQTMQVWDELTSSWVALASISGSGFVSKSGDTMSGPLVLSGAPTITLHAATKLYVDTADGTKVAKGGDTMSGPLVLPADPTLAMQAATKQYVDSADTGKVTKSGDTMTGLLTLSGAPVNALHAATKAYVDTAAAAGVPSGTIVMWSPAVGAVPAGWKVCDGTLGTPDLRDRFIIGAGTTYFANTFGGNIVTSGNGAHSHGGSSITAAGSHNHGGVVGGTAISIAQMPSHFHYDGGGDEFGTGSPIATGLASNNGLVYLGARYPTTSEGGNAAHDHTISSVGDHTHTPLIASDGNHNHVVTPPYYCLVFIMKS